MQKRISPLTSLRFFAALSVFVYHLSSVGILDPKRIAHFQLSQGVSFFFVLSGFVLQYTYRNTIKEIGSARFIFLRVARIYPLHLAAMLLGLVLVSRHVFISQIVAVATLTQAWIPDPKYYFAINGVSWTLSVEMFFYLLFPVLAFLLRRVPMALVAILLCAELIYFWAFHSSDQQISNTHFGICPFARLPEFVLGMICCEVYLTMRRIDLPIAAWTALEIGAIILMVFANWDVPFFPNRVWQFGGMSFTDWVYGIGCAPIYALVILVFALSGGWLSKALSSTAFVLLGEISFGFYLLHPLAIHIARRVSTGGMAGVVAFIIALVLAYAGWRLIEKPAMRLARRTVSIPKVSQLTTEPVEAA